MATTTSPKAPTTKQQPLEQIAQISRWFAAAVPAPSYQNATAQIGVHFEEVFEMAQVLRDAGTTYPAREQLSFAADVLGFLQRQLKSGAIEIAFDDIDRLALLDALCDQIVTAVGVAHMLGMDINGALKEVADSNDSKFDEDGQPIFNEQLKIMKSPRYRSPNLEAFVIQGEANNDRA